MSANTHSIHSLLQSRAPLIFVVLLILTLVDRTQTLVRFAFIYTDSDQTVLWLATKEMAAGNFYGFCFYGQNYNPLIESFLSIPFIKMGLSYPIALPLVTSILAISPFILCAFFLKKNSGAIYGTLPLLILLLLPPEYGMLTSMPRGFVTGIFFGTLGLFFLWKNKNSYTVAGSCLVTFSIFANPNAFLLLPLAIPVLFNKKEGLKHRIIYLIIGFCLGAILPIINAVYYAVHPELIVHASPKMGFSIHAFVYVVTHPQVYFDMLTPVFWKAGWVLLLWMIWIAYQLKRNHQIQYFYATLAFLLILFASFFSNKIADGRESVYFTGARMFLAYPIFIACAAAWYLPLLNVKKRAIMICTAMVLAFISVGIKIGAYDYFIQNQVRTKDYTVVGTTKVNDLKNTCKTMLSFGHGDIDLIIANSANGSDQLITYGCGCLVDPFPKTLQPDYDRRTWMLTESLNGTYSKILIHGEETRVWDTLNYQGLHIIAENKPAHWMLVENTRKTKDLLLEMKIIK